MYIYIYICDTHSFEVCGGGDGPEERAVELCHVHRYIDRYIDRYMDRYRYMHIYIILNTTRTRLKSAVEGTGRKKQS